VDLQAVGFAQLARLELIFSHTEEMQAPSQAAEQLVNGYGLAPRYSIRVISVLAHFQIDQGNLERVTHLVQKMGIEVDGCIGESETPYLLEPIYLGLLRLFVAQRNYNCALEWSQCLLHKAEAGCRIGRVNEILILQALAYHGMNDKEQALAALERAILLAQPEGDVRIFLDEGDPIVSFFTRRKYIKSVAATYQYCYRT
jgi:hypothetical protein